jgi:hypothetical protein
MKIFFPHQLNKNVISFFDERKLHFEKTIGSELNVNETAFAIINVMYFFQQMLQLSF